MKAPVAPQTHAIPAGGRPVPNAGIGLYRAACGALVLFTTDARGRRPTCPVCAQLEDDDEAALEALRQMPDIGAPVRAESLDTLAGYRPKKERR